MERGAARSPVLPAAGLLLGVVLIVVGVSLTWFHFEGDQGKEELAGSEFGMGWSVATFGVVAGIFGLVMWARARKKGGRAWAICALVAVTLPFMITAATTVNPEDEFAYFAASDIADEQGISMTRVQADIEDAFASGRYQATAGAGLLVSLVGSILVVASAILAIVWAKSFKRVAGPPLPAAPTPSTPPIPPMPGTTE